MDKEYQAKIEEIRDLLHKAKPECGLILFRRTDIEWLVNELEHALIDRDLLESEVQNLKLKFQSKSQ